MDNENIEKTNSVDILKTERKNGIHEKHRIYSRYIKRLLDFIFSLTALIVFSPVILIVAILVKIKLGSPIIFKQKRPGKNEKIFEIYKFKSMPEKRDENGNLLPDAVRLTRFGKILRASSLDELLELINILKGEMSFIGPRPLAVVYLPYYNETEKLRHRVTPGLTGLAQINGRNAISWGERFKYDVEYVEKVSFQEDLYIFIKTFLVVFSQKDISQAEEKPVAFHVIRQKELEEVKKTEEK